jgi:hypothetical protein
VFGRFAPDSPAPITEDPVALMKHRLTPKFERALYALRKQTVEPVFGIIKQVMGLRQFSMRGLMVVVCSKTDKSIIGTYHRQPVRDQSRPSLHKHFLIGSVTHSHHKTFKWVWRAICYV